MSNMPAQVWSCGGGTQSAAIAALIVRGDLPKPDYAYMVDTGRERTATIDYFHKTLKPMLAAVNVDIVLVKKSDYTNIDIYSGADNDTLMIPAFSNVTGEKGKMSNFCSGEWKRNVGDRYLRQTLKIENCVSWLGFSTDELKRVRTPRQQWQQLRYPLIFDVPMNRSQCIHLVLSMGWDHPPRSACWMCPNASDNEWREMKQTSPEDFAKAVQFESEIRLSDPNVFLHRSCKTLDLVDLTIERTLFDEDAGCAGGCFT